MGRPVQFVMSWVRGIDVIRLQRYTDGHRQKMGKIAGMEWKSGQIRKSDRA